jgi:bifunctional DNA-binding transcriptional regulator/antitoxin component of YhaV-PrlF toxin-antitoxin module
LTGKLTAGGRTTIPREVRERLGPRPGDKIAYEIDAEGAVRLLVPLGLAYLCAVQVTLAEEWEDPGDDAAYADL